MAYGTTKVDVIQSSTAGTPPQFNDGNGTQTGTLCRAWVNWNGLSGASPVVKASFNVSSVTRASTGHYTLAFTTALTDANYATTYGYVAPDTSGVNSGMALDGSNTTLTNKTSSQLALVVGLQTANTYLDKVDLSVAIFR
jgi:hypothetical protein